MKWRYGFLACCAIVIALAGAAVASGQEAAWICCESPVGCPGSQTCCDAGSLGMDPCDNDLPSFCMERCIRVAGAGTFTADQK